MPRSSVIAAIAKEASFSPADVAGLQLWLDASDLSTITESGGSVSQWDDKSGNGNHVSQPTQSFQPVTGTSTLNGLNVLTFSTDELVNDDGLFASQPFTVIGVAKSNSTGISQVAVGGREVDATLAFVFQSSTSGQFNAFAGVQLPSGVPHNTNANIISTVINSTSSSIAINGGTPATGDAGTREWDDVYIGSLRGAAYWDGDIAEVLVYSGVLSTADREALELHLAAKWGITLS